MLFFFSIFTMLILLVHELGISSRLLVSSTITFFKALKFLSYRSFTCLVRVISRYFILFVAIMKVLFPWFFCQPICHLYWSGLMIFYCCCCWWWWWWSCIQSLHWRWFISCRSYLVEFWGSLINTIISSANSNTLTSFPICITLVYSVLLL